MSENRGAIVSSFTPKWREGFRAEMLALLFSARRAEALVRIVTFGLACGFVISVFTPRGCSPVMLPSPMASLCLLALLVWLVWPAVRAGREAEKISDGPETKVTVHDEGFVAEGPWGSLAAAWSVVRTVRSRRTGVALVLDTMCIDVPGLARPSVEAIVGIFRASRSSRSPSEATRADADRGPYRASALMILDEDAKPEEWQPAPGFPHHAIAFTTRPSLVRAVARLRWRKWNWPIAAVVMTLVTTWIAVSEPAVVSAFTTLSLGFGILAVWLVGSWAARGIAATGDRFVAERKDGVLYAVGGQGLYVRTHHFERRVPWSRVSASKRTRDRLILETEAGVFVVPWNAFEKGEDRNAFERVVMFELEARKPSPPAEPT